MVCHEVKWFDRVVDGRGSTRMFCEGAKEGVEAFKGDVNRCRNLKWCNDAHLMGFVICLLQGWVL